MSEAYLIGEVTITPQGGGFYLLTHPSLPEPIKERGKENADAKAAEINAAAADDDGGALPAQGDLDAGVGGSRTEDSSQDGRDVELAELQAKLAASEALRAQLEQRARDGKFTTVIPGDQPAPNRVPAAVPRAFTESTAPEVAETLKKLGVPTTRIVLEENESIPPTGLFLGHNGRGYVIQPGIEVTVPNFLLNVLNDAVMSAPVVDNKTQKVLGYRNRMKYPYRKV